MNIWLHFTCDLEGEEIVGTFFVKKIAKIKLKRVYSWKSNQEKRQ